MKSCIYGGGDGCVRQGGNGNVTHAKDYRHTHVVVHPGMDTPDLEVRKSLSLVDLERNFDDSFSTALLKTQIETAVSSSSIVKKSLYHFDLYSKDGVQRTLEVLPIMDREFLQDIFGDIFPGMVVEIETDEDAGLIRAQIRGYLLDLLEGFK